ncbi:MAG: colicin production CvpA [Nevskia sp.]|nr:colicin production CvpA [Nevskia sp.]
MAWLDLVFLGVVLLSILIGVFRGFVREALSLATWILAFVLSLRYGPLLAERLQATIHAQAARTAIGYALVFFGVLIVGALLTYLVGILIRSAGLSPVDRMLGSGFGLLRGALLVVACVMLAGITSLHQENWWQQSRLAPELQPAANSLQTLIPHGWLTYLQPINSKDGNNKDGNGKDGERKPGDITVSNSEH